MQPIHVKRYTTPGAWAGTVEPEDRSWIVFVRTDGESTFWRRTTVVTEDGHTTHAYVDAELPRGVARTGDEDTKFGPLLPEPAPAVHPGPLDFVVRAVPAEPAREATADHPASVESPARFEAALNCRAVVCLGDTEHEAVRNLLNYVAQLCTAGSMDHTGLPVPGTSPRRYRAVWGGSGEHDPVTTPTGPTDP